MTQRHKTGLNRKILLIMVITFLAVFAFCFISFALIFDNREQNAMRREMLESFHRIESRVKDYIDGTDLASNTVMCSTWVQQLYTNYYREDSSQSYTNRSNAERFLSCFASMYDELDCFIVLGDGSYIKNNNSYLIDQDYRMEDQEWFDKLKENEKYRLFGYNSMFTKKIPDRSVTTYFQIKSIYNLKPIGFFVTNICYDSFRFLKEQLSLGEQLLITDQSGNLVCSTMDEAAADHLPSSEPGAIREQEIGFWYYDRILDGNWNVWIWKERTDLLQSIRNNIWMFLLLVPVIIIFLLVSLVFSRYLTRPIVLCTDALHEIRNENYNVQIPNHYKDEIGDMIDGFNDMSANIGHLLDMNRAMYKARLETEFRILQQRINPHFLCNTLEIINGMILCDEADKALELTGMLGRMYRYDLGEKDIATIAEEIDYLKVYLSILEYKYRDLKVEYRLDPETFPCLIPKFVCQPLVENTLKHGFRGKYDNCRLWIGIEKQEDKVLIRVCDNGAGIDPQLLRELEEKIRMLRDDQTIAVEEHIGLMNTARRLFLYFGKNCEFVIRSEQGNGTSIGISFPYTEQ